MKLRLTDNLLRVRLSEDEVAQVAAGATLSEQIVVGPEPGHALTWVLSVEDEATMGMEVRIEFEAGVLRVRVPKLLADLWASGDGDVMEATQENGSERPLGILIEKDRDHC